LHDVAVTGTLEYYVMSEVIARRVEGAVNAEVRRRALLALRREATDVVLSFWGGGGENPRKSPLTEFQRVLETA
jgi:hypothetical protein